jgi:hypothetical protein
MPTKKEQILSTCEAVVNDGEARYIPCQKGKRYSFRALVTMYWNRTARYKVHVSFEDDNAVIQLPD